MGGQDSTTLKHAQDRYPGRRGLSPVRTARRRLQAQSDLPDQRHRLRGNAIATAASSGRTGLPRGVVHSRPLSRYIAERVGIVHASPQAIILRAGVPAWHGSHFDLRAEVMARTTGVVEGRDRSDRGNPVLALVLKHAPCDGIVCRRRRFLSSCHRSRASGMLGSIPLPICSSPAAPLYRNPRIIRPGSVVAAIPVSAVVA